MELILCRVVESSCVLTHNIVPHISWRDLPCHRTTKRYADFPSMVIFPLLLRKFWIQTWFCNCLQYLCFFHIVFECTSRKHDQGMMLVLPNQFLCLVLSTSDQCFVSFQPIFMSSTYTDKNNPLSQLLCDTGASTSLFSDTESLSSDVDSCEEDGEGVDEDAGEEELAENPGTTNGT